MTVTPPAGASSGSQGVSGVFDRLGGDLDVALERLDVPAAVVDGQGRIRYQNRRGRDLMGDMLGRQFDDSFAPESQATLRTVFARHLLGTGPVTAVEALLRTREGLARSEVHTVAIESGDRVVGVFGIAAGLRAAAQPQPTRAGAVLTPRQTEVLALLAEGRSTAQIADELSISTETVRNHIRGILRALGVRSRLEAVVESLRLGLLAA